MLRHNITISQEKLRELAEDCMVQKCEFLRGGESNSTFKSLLTIFCSDLTKNMSDKIYDHLFFFPGPEICPPDYKESDDNVFWIYFLLRFLGTTMLSGMEKGFAHQISCTETNCSEMFLKNY